MTYRIEMWVKQPDGVTFLLCSSGRPEVIAEIVRGLYCCDTGSPPWLEIRLVPPMPQTDT